MIVILKHNPNRDQLDSLISWLQEKGVTIHTSIGEANTILGLVGDTIGNFDTHEFKLLYPVLNALSNVYDSKYNTGYKSKRLVMEQALFLFDKWLKEERKRLDEIDNDDVYEERGIDLNED